MTAIDRLAGLVGNVAIKAPCRAATTANIALTGLQTIDGVALAANDRVLVWKQTSAIANGIYLADTGTWTRDVDFAGTGDCVKGTLVLVTNGATYGQTILELTTTSPVIGTTTLDFAIIGTPALAYASAYIQTLLPALTAAAARVTLDVPANAEAILKTFAAAKGDLFAASANDVPAILSVGADGKVPMARSAAALGLEYVSPFKSMIYGLTYAVGTDTTNDWNIAAGGAMDSTGAEWIQVPAATKQSDAVWAADNGATPTGGLDLIGSAGNNDFYMYAIKNPTTGVVGTIYSLSAVGPSQTNTPGYTLFRLFGWFKRSGGAIVACHTYEGDGGSLDLIWDSPTLDISLSNTLTTARRTDPVKVPLLFSTIAHLNVVMADSSTVFASWIYCPDQTDLAPSTTVAPLGNFIEATTALGDQREIHVRTSAAGLIAARSTLATVDTYLVSTIGFHWSRR